jgi:hypothetical protein
MAQNMRGDALFAQLGSRLARALYDFPQGCLDFLGQVLSLHDINVRLWAFLDEHYHKALHASQLGRSPARVYETAGDPTDRFNERKLREALTVRVRRRVRRDSTLSMGWRRPPI